MRVFLISLVCIFFSVQYTQANTIVVANTNDSGTGSLRVAISTANNYDTIRFDPTLITTINDTIKLASTINITRNLVIIGLFNSSAALYISGQNNVQIFNADLSSLNSPTPKDLRLDSLRFINGNSTSGGGALKFRGADLTVSNSIFTNNTSTFGGAIFSQESFGDVIISSCTFAFNTATTGPGGGVYSGREIILINSNFDNNDAVNGGAIFSVRKLSIDSSIFTNNTATDKGGAVNLSSNTSTTYHPILITNSTFENNSANFGGGIYAYLFNAEIDMTIDNTTFDNNHSVWIGGAVYAASNWYKSSIDLNNSRIINNTSNDAGAGVHCKTVYENATILVDSCLVENNVAIGVGGGISVLTSTNTSSPADTAILRVTNSTILNNSASKGGGMSCSGTGGSFGAGVISVDNSIISNNTATLEGGGIYSFSSASNDLGAYPSRVNTSINYSTIDNNHAGENGGGIYSNSYSASSNGVSQSRVFVNQSTFVNNTADDDGGAIGNYSRNNGFLAFNAGVSVDVKNSTIYNNNATNGGAVSSKFSSFWSASDPGAMAAQFTSSIVAHNGNNSFYAADSIVSFGYNIFSDDSVSVPGSIGTDQMQVDSITLSLGTLQLNGGFTPTVLPGITSPAINAGSPSDGIDAQNTPIIGIRDAGSAENITVMYVAECDSFLAPSGNVTYYASGFYTDTIDVNGTDSLVYIDLSINTSYSTLIDSICAGETYISPSGNMYTTSTNFIDTIPNYLSCDSIISVSLTVFDATFSSIDTIACASYISPSGILYQISGIYTDTILNVGGCDSVITINLSFGNTSSSISETACLQYASPSGTIYNSSGIYSDTIPNASGCDSIISIDLTILSPSIGTDIQVACDSFTWIDGVTYSTTTNVPTHTLMNAVGCDSVVTLDLTINYSNSGVDVQTACSTYDWIDGNTYTSSNNSAQWTVTNAAGCDSIVTLDLTINSPNSGVDIQTACDSYDWIDGNTYAASNNSAQWTLTNAAGCDSIVTLDLTVNYASSGVDVQTACESYNWIDGNTYTASNNSAQWTVTNSTGCDSVVTLNLTIGTVEIGTTQIDDVTLEANAIGATYKWLDCDDNYSVITGESNQTFTASVNGNYAVEINQNGCADTSACVVISNVSLGENDLGQGVVIYPNPTLGKVMIEFLDGESQVKNVRVKDALGQEISHHSVSDLNEFEIYIGGAAGVYFIEVETDDGIKTEHRVLKQ